MTHPIATTLNHIAAVKELQLPPESYIVIGGSCLAVRGIRESNDIDIVVTPEIFQLLLDNKGWEVDESFKEKWHRERLKKGVFEVYTDMIIESENRFVPASELIKNAEVIQDVPFLPLLLLLFFKKDNSRAKDLEDIKLIEEYLHIT